nr:tripartite motif-containing protein 71 [Biomphalaria glabrata]
MTDNINTLNENGDKVKEKAKSIIKYMHNHLDAFYMQLERTVKNIVGQKKDLLEYHAFEIEQYETQVKSLSKTAECYLKGTNVYISQYGPKLKAELECCIEQAKEFNAIDYDTFISLELEDNLKEMFKVLFCNIVSINKYNKDEKQVLESFYLDSSIHLKDVAPVKVEVPSPDRSSNISAADLNSNVIAKPLNRNYNYSSIKTETMPLKENNNLLVDTASSLPVSTHAAAPSEGKKNLNKTSPSSTRSNIQYCKDLEVEDPPKLVVFTPSHFFSKETLSNFSTSKPSQTGASAKSCPVNDITQSISACKISANSFVNQSSAAPQALPSESHQIKPSIGQSNSKLQVLPSESHQIKSSIGQSNSKLQVLPSESHHQIKPSIGQSNSKLQVLPSESHQIKPSIGQSNSKFVRKIVGQVKEETKLLDSYCCNGEPISMDFDITSCMNTSVSSASEIKAQLIDIIQDDSNKLFNHPTGLTVTVDGKLIVTDTGNNLVKVLDDRKLVLSLGENDGIDFHRPSAVVSDTLGNIYVKDDRCIRMFNCRGTHLRTAGKGDLYFPYGLSLTKNEEDNVLVLVDVSKRTPSVYHYSINKDRLMSYRYMPLVQFALPTSKVRFLATYKNLLLASDLGSSCMFLSSITGESIRNFGSFGSHAGNFKEPSGVTVDCAGNWIVGDSKNNRLQVFNKDGDFLGHIKLSYSIRRPSGIHLTNDGHLYIINYLDNVSPHVLHMYRISICILTFERMEAGWARILENHPDDRA